MLTGTVWQRNHGLKNGNRLIGDGGIKNVLEVYNALVPAQRQALAKCREQGEGRMQSPAMQ